MIENLSSSIKNAGPALKWMKATYQLVRNPAAEGSVFDLGDALLELGGYKGFQSRLLSDPISRNIIEKRILIAPYTVNELAHYPAGSFGKAYADHLIEYNLDPFYFRPPARITDESFSILRLRQAHDVWHVVTGFDTSVGGELGVHGFMLGQMMYPLSCHLVGLTFLGACFKEEKLFRNYLDHVFAGWKMGQQAGSLFNENWDSNWETPISSLRERLNVKVYRTEKPLK